MASTYKLNSLGGEFKVKVTDCTGGTVPPESSIIDQKISFFKSDGTTFEKQASLETDPENPSEYFIVYQNTAPETTILDLTGLWQYAASIKLINNDIFETSENKIFWVVKSAIS